MPLPGLVPSGKHRMNIGVDMKNNKKTPAADQQQEKGDPAKKDMSKYLWFFIAINVIMALVAAYKIIWG